LILKQNKFIIVSKVLILMIRFKTLL